MTASLAVEDKIQGCSLTTDDLLQLPKSFNALQEKTFEVFSCCQRLKFLILSKLPVIGTFIKIYMFYRDILMLVI